MSDRERIARFIDQLDTWIYLDGESMVACSDSTARDAWSEVRILALAHLAILEAAHRLRTEEPADDE